LRKIVATQAVEIDALKDLTSNTYCALPQITVVWCILWKSMGLASVVRAVGWESAGRALGCAKEFN